MMSRKEGGGRRGTSGCDQFHAFLGGKRRQIQLSALFPLDLRFIDLSIRG